MPDQKVTANGNVQVWLVPSTGIANFRSPTAAEINAGLNVTNAIAWEGTTIPTATESDDVDDRSLLDKGNATTRGAAQFEAALNFFTPSNHLDLTDLYAQVYNMLRIPRVPLYIVIRVLQAPEGVATAATAGQWISVFRFLTDSWTDDISEDDSYKYAIGFLTQGELAVYTQVKNAAPITIARAGGTGSLAVGAKAVIRATLGGKRATQVATWSSSNPAVATVSPNGVVVARTSGTASITATHPAASAASTALAITVT